MKKLNEKGLSIVELLVCFVIVAVVAITLLNTLMEYKTEEEIENIKNHVESYKNTVTRVIQSDITDYALIAYDNKKLTVEDGKYTFTVTLKFQKTFQDGSNEKTLKIFASDKENYILYPDVVEQNGSYIKQDVKYELEANGTVLDIDTENDNSTQKKEYNDLRFAYLNEDSIRVKNGNTISIDIPITHSELGDEYHIKIVAPLGLLNSPPPTEAENCTLIYTGGGCNPSIITRNFGEQWGTLCQVTKTGYKLKGWKTGDSCTGKEVKATDVCTKEKPTQYLYSCFESNKVKIQYNINGGTWGPTTNTQLSVNSNGYVTKNNNTIISNYNYGAKGINLQDYNKSNYIYTTKTGYKPPTGAEWYRISNGVKKTFSQSVSTIKANDLCSAANNDCTATLYVNWIPNNYIVTLNPNGGKYLNTTSNSKKTVTYDSTSNSNIGVPTRTGYTFAGWYTATSGGTKVFDENGKYVSGDYWTTDGKWKNVNNVILYAQWIVHKVNVQFNMNGGTFGTTSSTTISHDGQWITNNGSKIVASYYYGQTGIDLANYNNPGYINITKSGYSGKLDAEWNTKSDGTGKSFKHSGSVVRANDLCDASNGDCTVTLYVNWDTNKVYLKFKTNGGSLASSHGSTISVNNGYVLINNNSIVHTINYNGSLSNAGLINYANSSYVNIVKTGHHAVDGAEWKVDGGTKTYDQDVQYSASDFCDASKSSCIVTLAVNWSPNVCTITYNPNGGTFSSNSSDTVQKCNYGNKCSNMRNANGGYYGATKNYYIPKSGAEWINGSTTYDQDKEYYAVNYCSNLANSNQSITLKVNWRETELKLQFHANNGSLASSHGSSIGISDGYITKNSSKTVKTANHGDSIDLPNYNNKDAINITRAGYKAKSGAEWYKANESSTTYNQAKSDYGTDNFCNIKSSDCTVTLKVNWEKDESIPSGMCDTAPIGADYFGNTPLVTAKEAPSKNVGKSVDTSSWGKWCYYSWTDGPYIKSVGYDRICYTEKCGRFKGWTATQVNAETKKILGNESCRFHRAWCFR